MKIDSKLGTSALKNKRSQMLRLNAIDTDQMLEILNFIPSVQFWIKDLHFRYVKINTAFLENYGMRYDKEIIGKTDYDITSPFLADQFRTDDIEVLKGKSVINRVEMVGGFDQVASWFLTSKRPLYSNTGEIIGTIGITQPLSIGSQLLVPFGEIEKVVRHIHANFNTKMKNQDLAEMANLSLSSFERKFQKLFSVSPQKYIVKYRIQIASKLLIKSADSISQIANQTGFSDQSHLIREFKKFAGITPHQFRRNFYNHSVDK